MDSRLVEWAIRVDPADLRALRSLRLRSGLKACRAADGVWLRGPGLDPELEAALRRVPAEARYRCARGQLYPAEGKLPVGELPEGPWEDLRSFLPLIPQTPRGTAAKPTPVTLEVVDAPHERSPQLLLTSFAAWERWALRAAQLRLSPLQFATDEQGQVLVRGEPLPPLPGRRFHLAGAVAVPCGKTWAPAVPAEVVSELFDLLPGELLLLQEERWDVLAPSRFAKASRSAVREAAHG